MKLVKLLALFPLLLLAACATTAPKLTAGAQLNQHFEQYFEEDLALNPVSASFIGDNRYHDQLELDASPEFKASTVALGQKYLNAVRAIDPAGLTGQEQLSRDMFIYQRELSLEASRFPGRLLPISQFDGGMAVVMPMLGAGDGPQPFATYEDHQRWWKRARQFPAWVDGAIEAMREGMARGVVQPRMVMAKVVPQLEQLIAAHAEDSVFFGPVALLPASLTEAERTAAEEEYRRLVLEVLNPAYARLRDFIRDEYLPACRDTVAWSALPEGQAWYALQARRHTTTSMSAEAIHALGLSEVARIRSGMEQVMREVGFKGDLAAFFQHVQEDPQFFFANAKELIDHYQLLKKRIDAELPRLFSSFPRADYEVREVEAYRAASAAGGSYMSAPEDGSRPGIFYINTYNLKAQPIYGTETLSLHEASPGHHFQVTIQQELQELPRFRRHSGNVAYVEGWALYAESLGKELGMFTEPMQWYGRLSDEMLRAMRLVVDTGLHAKGWSREQAIQYMKDNSSLAPSDIEAEVERYIVYPGQALGYKIGDLRIQGMRRKAEQALGKRFDIRAFHDQVLRDGALPMAMLETKIDRWIAAELAR